MPYWVYILQSQSTGRYYCGYSENVDQRIKQHNDPEYRLTRTTKIWKGPWVLIWKQECLNRSEAVVLERKIKKRGIGRYLQAQLVESRWKRDPGEPNQECKPFKPRIGDAGLRLSESFDFSKLHCRQPPLPGSSSSGKTFMAQELSLYFTIYQEVWLQTNWVNSPQPNKENGYSPRK